MSKVPNPNVAYLHPNEMIALGLEEEYLANAQKRKAEKTDGPDSVPRKVKEDAKRIA